MQILLDGSLDTVSWSLFQRGTGVPPVNHAQDARATSRPFTIYR